MRSRSAALRRIDCAAIGALAATVDTAVLRGCSGQCMGAYERLNGVARRLRESYRPSRSSGRLPAALAPAAAGGDRLPPISMACSERLLFFEKQLSYAKRIERSDSHHS